MVPPFEMKVVATKIPKEEEVPGFLLDHHHPNGTIRNEFVCWEIPQRQQTNVTFSRYVTVLLYNFDRHYHALTYFSTLHLVRYPWVLLRAMVSDW